MGLIETLNSLGVSLSANPSSSVKVQDLGSRLTVAALSLQLAVIIIFVFLAGLFHLKCAKAKLNVKNVTTILITLYVSMFLIFIRCIYRLAEHMGSTAVHLDDPESLLALSPILRYEWFFYVFEGMIMLLNSVLWNIWNPGRYLPKSSHVYLSQDGRTELEVFDQSDDRPLLAKTASVLTFGFLFSKRDHRTFETLHDYPNPAREAQSELRDLNQSSD
jgi:hypothetical protein